MIRFQNTKEILIVFGVMTGIFLPVRLFFVSHVSDNWFGSFGVISAISILILVLSKKQKLGKFGKIFQKQIDRLHSSKFGKFVYFQSIIILIIFGILIFSIEIGNSMYVEEKQGLLLQTTQITNQGLEFSPEIEFTLERLVLGIGLTVLTLIFEFPLFAGALSIINDVFDGWILHFYTVVFIEQLEIFGILLFSRIAKKIKI
jgi:hypothetical protein